MDDEAIRLFVDMDGTLAEFCYVDTLEKLYEKDYFLKLKPHNNLIEAIKLLKNIYPEIEIFILSSVLSDSEYAVNEKNLWLDNYLPEIDIQHRIYPLCGTDKKASIDGGIGERDFLIDDYTHNLNQWQSHGNGIKFLNGINGTHGTWKGDSINIEKCSNEIAFEIISVIKSKLLQLENKSQGEAQQFCKRRGR